MCGLCRSDRTGIDDLTIEDELVSDSRRYQPESLLNSYLLKEDSEQCEHQFSDSRTSFWNMYDNSQSRRSDLWSSQEIDSSPYYRSNDEPQVPEYLESKLKFK